MRRYNLWFIKDKDLFKHVKDTILKYRFTIDLKGFSKNIIDPIKLTFDSKVYSKSIEELIEDEIMRQMDKSNTNHIWYFNQNIFNFIGEWWEVPKHWYDIINMSKKIFVEMKNKHNTMNSSSSQKTYMKMQNTILKYPRSKCLLVEVVAKNSQNIQRKCAVDWTSMSNDRIRRVSIDKFYEIVTWDSYAFVKLCNKLPAVIDDVLLEIWDSITTNTVLEELKELSPSVVKSIFMFSFGKYEWFEKFFSGKQLD